MRALANGLFGVGWTVLVTASGVALARATGEESFVPSAQRLWARGLLRGWGVRVDTIGAEHVDRNGTYIVMANHRSHVDVPILFMALPFVPGFLAKKELARIPFLAMALRAGRHVLIDRSDQSSALEALKSAATEIRSGKTIAVFPEGTRGDGERLAPFKKGGFLIAKRAGVPILPVGIRGTERILARSGRLPRGGRAAVHIGAPIPPEEVRRLNVDALSVRVKEAIMSLTDGSIPVGRDWRRTA